MQSIRAVLEFALGTKVDHYIFHRFIERTPTCETLLWKVAMDSKQERLQDSTSTNK